MGSPFDTYNPLGLAPGQRAGYYGSGAPPYVNQWTGYSAVNGGPGGIGIQGPQVPDFGGGWKMPQPSDTGGGSSWGGIGKALGGLSTGDKIKYGLEGAGLIMSGIEAYKANQAANKQQDTANQQWQQEQALRQQQYQLDALKAQRDYESNVALSMRRAQAIRNILGQFNADKAGGDNNAQATQMESQ